VSQVANASLTLTEWDGDALASGVATRAVALRGVEEYDIIDPSTLDRTNKPWVWNDGDVWFHQKTVYELGAGRTSADVTYTLDSGNAGMAVAAMLPLDVPRPVCAAYDSLYFYIPDLDSTNVQDFSRPHTLTYKGGIGANYIVSADSLLEGAVGIAGTVITMFKNNADSRYGLGLSLGILPLHNGSSDSLTAFADSYRYRIASGGGVYANLLGAYEYAYNWTQANRTLQAHVYRQWFDAAAYDSSKVMFVGKADDNEWVFTGRPLAFVADTTTSPRIIGKYVGEQLAYDNLPSPPQQIPAGGLVVNSAAYAPGWMLFRVVPHLWIEPE
jgi:hypothetical protein